MRKILASLSLLAVLVVPVAVLAQEVLPESCNIRADTGLDGCPAVGGTAEYDIEYGTVSGAICCLFSTINFIVNWIFTVLLVIAMVMIIIGAFTFLTAAGDEAKITAARNYIMYAVIGLAVAFLARAVPAIVKFLMAPGT